MKRVYTVFSFLLIALLASGQYDPKENFYDAEFFLAEEDYSEALYSFTQVYKDGYEDNANINYRIGICLLNIKGRKTEAIPYLLKASQSISKKYKEGSFKELNAPSTSLLYLGNAYRIDYQIDEAIKQYKHFLEIDNTIGDQTEYANLQIKACENLKKKLDSGEDDYQTGTLGQLNQERVDIYNPALSGDLKTLAYMGKHKFYNGVYVTKKQDGKWLRPLNITPSIQSDGNQDVLSLSNDGNRILLAWSDNFDSEIWVTEFLNGRWNVSKPIGKPINSKYYESNACFSPDEKSIYFTSNRKESLGGMDIFKCNLNDDGSWSDLILLGDMVNTPLNEENPYVSPDGKRLYFSSQGHNGLGGFDLYYCEIATDGSLGNPINLGYPLNTSDDDFSFIPNQINYDGYLTIYSKAEEGQVDLYRFEYIPESAQAVEVAFEVPKEAKEAIEEISITTQQAAVTEEVEDDAVEEAVKPVVKETPQMQDRAELDRTEKYIVKPIFFDFDSYKLSANSKKKMEEIAILLKKFPNLKLEIKAHTDAVGNSSYNQTLSKRRADAVANYLATQGIAESRLVLKPLGETEHIAINRTANNLDAPKGRALNRRVQFSVLMAGDILIQVEKIKIPEDLKIK